MKIENKIFWSALVLVIVYTAFLLIPTGIDFSITGFVASGRLPTVGGDSGNWGSVLNTYLQQEHTSTGGHKNVTVSGSLDVDGNTNITGDLNVSGKLEVGSDVNITGDLIVNQDANVTGNLTIGDKITFRLGEVIDNIVAGWIQITGSLNVSNNLTVNEDAKFEKNVNVTGNLTVSGTGGPSGWILIESQTASNDATVEFVTGITSDYKTYMFVLANILPVDDGIPLQMRVSDDGGATFEATTNYKYVNIARIDTGVDDSAQSASSTFMRITPNNGPGNQAEEAYNGIVYMFDPAAGKPKFTWTAAFLHLAGALITTSGAGAYTAANAIDGIQFYEFTGNISSGTFSLYGMKI